jgi:hypothetical protein
VALRRLVALAVPAVFSSVSGNVVRVRFTNTFGTTPLQIASGDQNSDGDGAAAGGA